MGHILVPEQNQERHPTPMRNLPFRHTSNMVLHDSSEEQ